MHYDYRDVNMSELGDMYMQRTGKSPLGRLRMVMIEELMRLDDKEFTARADRWGKPEDDRQARRRAKSPGALR
jgi:hypothetical protein